MVVLDKTLANNLTRVYVALAMTREIAQRNPDASSETVRSMETLIHVASRLLEEVLDTAPDSQLSTEPAEFELIM